MGGIGAPPPPVVAARVLARVLRGRSAPMSDPRRRHPVRADGGYSLSLRSGSPPHGEGRVGGGPDLGTFLTRDSLEGGGIPGVG